MSSLAMALHVTNNPPGDWIDEDQNEQISPSESLQLKDSNQMETDGVEELGKHLEDLIDNEEDDDEAPNEEEISFGPSHSFFRPPLFSRVLVTSDLRTLDFWASICIPVLAALGNVTDAMFDALDEFLMKMKEAHRCFTVVLHNLTQYAQIAEQSPAIDQRS